MKRRPSYRAIDREEDGPGNPIDLTVHHRTGGAKSQLQLARAAQAVVDTLGRRRKVWFDYEDLLSRITDRRQAAYFDLGVEHGIAAAAANGLTKASPTQRAVADRIVQEVIRTGVARDDAVRAAVLAVWGLRTYRTNLRTCPASRERRPTTGRTRSPRSRR